MMWKVLGVYGVNGELIQAVKSFCMDSKACDKVGRNEEDWFSVKDGLWQGCVMSPWLFNMFVDGVIRMVNVKSVGERSENVEWGWKGE